MRYFSQINRKSVTEHSQSARKTFTEHSQNKYTVSTNNEQNQANYKKVPIRRCQAYQQLNLTRREGAKLCALAGLGCRYPLSEKQMDCLSAIAKTYKSWKAAGHSLNYFVQEYFN